MRAEPPFIAVFSPYLACPRFLRVLHERLDLLLHGDALRLATIQRRLIRNVVRTGTARLGLAQTHVGDHCRRASNEAGTK
jgi:hypothetical protein